MTALLYYMCQMHSIGATTNLPPQPDRHASHVLQWLLLPPPMTAPPMLPIKEGS